MVDPNIEIEEKEAARNQKCMGCYRLLFGGPVYIVRINFAAVAGGWRLCLPDLFKIFNRKVLEPALEKIGMDYDTELEKIRKSGALSCEGNNER